MANSVASIRDAITEQFEQNGWNGLPGSTANSPVPFYVDVTAVKQPGGSTLYYLQYNYGYGSNISANGIASLQTQASIGLSETDAASFLSAVAALKCVMAASPSTTAYQTQLAAQQAANAANDEISNSVNSLLTPSNVWGQFAQSVMDNYYTNTVIPSLTNTFASQGITLSALPVGLQAALEDAWLNTGGAFLGPHPSTSNLVQDIVTGNVVGDYVSAAYELAFNTATTGNTPYEARMLWDAATALGLTPSQDGSLNITSLTGSAATQNVIEFLQMMATGQYNPAAFIATGPGTSFYQAVQQYENEGGFYVLQPNDSIATVAQQVVDAWSAYGLQNFTAAELASFNAALGITNFGAGSVIYTPTSATQTGSQLGAPPPVDPGEFAVYVPSGTGGVFYTTSATLGTSQMGQNLDGKIFVPATGQTIAADLVTGVAQIGSSVQLTLASPDANAAKPLTSRGNFSFINSAIWNTVASPISGQIDASLTNHLSLCQRAVLAVSQDKLSLPSAG